MRAGFFSLAVAAGIERFAAYLLGMVFQVIFGLFSVFFDGKVGEVGIVDELYFRFKC